MTKKILAFTALLFTSSLAIADQGLPFVVDYSYYSDKPNKIGGFWPGDSNTEFTFKVSQTRALVEGYGNNKDKYLGKPCDKLTVDCNGQILTIEPGQSGICKLSPGQKGSFYDNNFLNGTEGTITTLKD